MTFDAIPLTRKDAERKEDNWAELFWHAHRQDMADGDYELYRSSEMLIFVNVKDSCLSLSIQGLEGEIYTCEIFYCLDEDATHRFLVQLRLKNSLRYKLTTILKKAFGCNDGVEKFKSFCEKIGIDYHVNTPR